MNANHSVHIYLQKISPNLSKLVNYIEAVHFPGFENDGKFYHMSSFGESKAFKYFEDPEQATDFVRYNSRQISRIYPGAKRQDSSNFKPLSAWNTGCQIGKINISKPGICNRILFTRLSRIGY